MSEVVDILIGCVAFFVMGLSLAAGNETFHFIKRKLRGQ